MLACVSRGRRTQGAAHDVPELRGAPNAPVALRPRGPAHAVQRLRGARPTHHFHTPLCATPLCNPFV